MPRFFAAWTVSFSHELLEQRLELTGELQDPQELFDADDLVIDAQDGRHSFSFAEHVGECR